MIIVKTEMSLMPQHCKDCSIHLSSISMGEKIIGCPLLKDWITQEEITNGKLKLEDCPLEENTNIK